VLGNEGGVANQASSFQVANCAALPYGPKLSFRLTGGLGRLGHPAIHAVLKAKPGEANTQKVSVLLPEGELLDNARIRSICTRVDFAARNCPPGSLLGRVRVVTPLLEQPLKGSAYLRSSQHELPDLVLDLRGQIDIEAVARVDSVKGRLRTIFETVPDVPFSRVELDLVGGSKGLLQNSNSLCEKPKRATVKMTGQNGAGVRSKVKLQAACGKKARHKRHSGKAGR
jgi:hypothetical protein